MIPTRRGPLRVAMVTAFAYPLMAGIATHVHEVATHLGAAGVDVTVLTTDRTWDLPVEEQLPGYRVRRWRAYPRSRDYYLAPGLARHLLRADDYDVVHVEGVHSLVAPTALAAARRAGIPSVLTLHTGGHSSALRNSLRPLQWRLLTPLLRSTVIVATGENERDIFAAVLKDTEGTIRLIRNGSEPLPIDRSAEKPAGSPLLVSVGRFERLRATTASCGRCRPSWRRRPTRGWYSSALGPTNSRCVPWPVNSASATGCPSAPSAPNDAEQWANSSLTPTCSACSASTRGTQWRSWKRSGRAPRFSSRNRRD